MPDIMARIQHAGLAGLLTVVMIGLALAVPVWLFLHAEEYVVGWGVWGHPVEGNRLLAQAAAPWTAAPRLLLVEAGVKETDIVGRWLLARGVPRLVGRWNVLMVHTIHTLPLVPAMGQVPAEGLGHLLSTLVHYRGMAILLRATVLLLGFMFLRLAAGMLSGVFSALLIWHAAVVASFEGFLTLPAGSLWAVLLGGFGIGALLGGQSGNLLSYLAQRLALILLLSAEAGDIASFFGWPVELTRGVAVIGTLLSPAIGLWLLAAYLLALGLGAKGASTQLILGATGMVIHSLLRGQWVPGWHFPRLPWRRPRRRQSHGTDHEVPLDALVHVAHGRRRTA